jgi:branched-chain amino acid transport system ATP-binding protein
MLAVEGLRAGYGKAEVLHGVSLEIAAGEVVTLLGRNGMGKTTTISAIMGLVQPRGGRVLFKGEEIQTLGPVRIARLGLGLVPEGRQIFPNLTVEENLIAMAADRRGAAQPWTAPRIYRFFPHPSASGGPSRAMPPCRPAWRRMRRASAWATGWITLSPASRTASNAWWSLPWRWRASPT